MTIHDTEVAAATPTRTTHNTETHDPATTDPLNARLAAPAVVAARVLSGLFAGFFLTYAMSVVIGLARVDDETYVSTFQAINATIRNPTFAVVFFGTVPVTLIAGALARGTDRRVLGAGAAFLFATMVITFVCNVPLNDQLATYDDLDATSAAAARNEFEDSWNRWNLLRTATALAGAGLVAATVRTGAQRSAR